MEKFTDFAKRIDETINLDGISGNVALASTNYAGWAGVWRVGLFSESTHGGYRIADCPSTVDYSKNRGRYYTPSTKCLREMVEHAKNISQSHKNNCR